MTSGGHEMEIEGEGPNYQNDAQDHLFGLQTLALLELLVLTGKKLAFKFSTYIFEYRSLPTYINCTLTHM